MSPPVTLPGDLPGLLRRCAPVHRDGHFGVVSGDFPADGTVPESVADLELDLSDPTGRDIAARWLAERLGLKVGWTAPTFVFIGRLGAPEQDGELQYVPGWMLVCDGGDVEMFFAEPVIDENGDRRGVHVPDLTLDPTEGPEALAQICLHVAGRRT